MLTALMPLAALAAGGERFACNANALSKTERSRHDELGHRLLAAVQEKGELPAGYALRLPQGDLMAAAEWVSYERKCCPFFTFALEQSADGGPVWLRITGPEGVKVFIREAFGL
jgi:hypothetical protein